MQPTRVLCPWDSPGKNNGVGFHSNHFLLQGIFPTQGSNPGHFQGSNGETDIENRPMDKLGGEEGEGEMYEECNIEIYNTMYKTDSQW